MKPILIIYDKTSLRSCNLLDMVLAGVFQTYENCIFAKNTAHDHCKVTNRSNKSISCIIYKDANDKIIQKYANCIVDKIPFYPTIEIYSADNLLQTVFTPQQIFCVSGCSDFYTDNNFNIIRII